MNVFKVLDKNTGLFATAGFSSWTKNGKSWSSEGALKSALTTWTSWNGYGDRRRQVPEAWEVIVYTYVETEQNHYAAKDLAERKPKK
jgi:hypothetical protein